MPANFQRLIRDSFTGEQWKTLNQNKEFTSAVERAATQGEAESVIAIGSRLLAGEKAKRTPGRNGRPLSH